MPRWTTNFCLDPEQDIVNHTNIGFRRIYLVCSTQTLPCGKAALGGKEVVELLKDQICRSGGGGVFGESPDQWQRKKEREVRDPQLEENEEGMEIVVEMTRTQVVTYPEVAYHTVVGR